MATEEVGVVAGNGLTVYASLWRMSDGLVFDLAGSPTNTFRAIGSSTTPYKVLTEDTNQGGVGRSFYRWAGGLDLATVQPGGAPVNYLMGFYQQLGGSPAPLTDSMINHVPVTLQFGEHGSGVLDAEFDACFTTTAGLAVRMLVTLLRNGLRVPLGDLDAAAECTLTVREHGAGVDLFTVGPVTVGADGTFELSQSTPGFTADRTYVFTMEIEENGNTHTIVKHRSVHP